MDRKAVLMTALITTLKLTGISSKAGNSTSNISTTQTSSSETTTLREYGVTTETATRQMISKLQVTNGTNIIAEDFTSKAETQGPFKRLRCFDGAVPDSVYLSQCCRNEYLLYYQRWHNGGYYLTTILERLQRWNCTEFHIECKAPTWPFTDFTKLMYDRFCNHESLEKKCVGTIREVVQRYGFIKPSRREEQVTEKKWPILIESLNSALLAPRDLAESCVQVALFDRTDGGVGRFHEIVEPFFPFCGLQWAGYDYYSAMYRDVSPWTGISSWCQGSIIVCMAVMMVLCIATVVANATIIGVFASMPKLRNSQAVYKISLAIADLLVGVIVWPNMIVMQYLTFFKPRTMGDIVESPSASNQSRNYFPFGNESLPHRSPSGSFQEIFSKPYILFMGFFTMLLLVVSIYTLMWASFDRFWAVFRPLRYNKHNAKSQAKIACATLWVVAILVSALPTFIEDIKYSVMSSIFITSEGSTALALLLIALILPLIVTWVVTIMTFETSKQHARSRQRIVSANSSGADSLERRLAKTLSLMVGIFTLCVLPALMCTIAGFAIPNTTWSEPRNLMIANTTAYTTSEYVAIILLTSNSLWNCFIYSLRTQGFRDAADSNFSQMSEKTGLKYIGRGALYILHGARRVSLSSLYTMRRFSAASTSDARKKSTSSFATGLTKVSESGSSGGRTSVDVESPSVAFGQSTTTNGYSTMYVKSGGKVGKCQSGVELRVERKKQQHKEGDEYVGEDSTFGSFAVDAGTDRFFHSVMENVPEEIEEVVDEKKTEQENLEEGGDVSLETSTKEKENYTDTNI